MLHCVNSSALPNGFVKFGATKQLQKHISCFEIILTSKLNEK